ncbi:MAG: hypothetical protein PHY02_09560 [Phycisphaerae bacterium]|nr:hypothetical protein [Phycisphaerae bacterium]
MKTKTQLSIILLLVMYSTAAATVPAGETIREFSTCNGTATTFNFTIPCGSADDIKVYKRLISTGVQTLLIQDTDYTISLTTDGDHYSGGTVTISPALASTYKVVITRDGAQTQETSAESVNPTSVEAMADKITRITQDLKDRKNRSIRLQESDADTDLELPVLRADKYVAFNDDNDLILTAGPRGDSNIPVSSFIETLFDDSGPADALTTLSGRPVINVKTYGAAGNDSTDDYLTITNAVVAASEANYPLYFPPGIYQISKGLEITTDNMIIIADNATLKPHSTYTGTIKAWDYDANVTEMSLMRVLDCNNFQIYGMTFDQGGWEATGDENGGGLTIFHFVVPEAWTEHFIIENCTFNNCDKCIIVANDVRDVVVNNCKMLDFTDTAISFDQYYPGGVVKHYPIGLRFTNNFVSTTSKNNYAIYLSGFSDAYIHNNKIKSGMGGIIVKTNDFGTQAENCVISNNTINIANATLTNIDSGIHIRGTSFVADSDDIVKDDFYARGISITNNFINSSTDHSTDTTNSNIAGIQLYFAEDVTIQGNRISNFPVCINMADVKTITDEGVYASRRTCPMIIGNTFANASRSPIVFNSVKGATIIGNVFKNWGRGANVSAEYKGIDIGGQGQSSYGQKNVKIIGNHFVDYAGSHNAFIANGRSAQNCYIFHNTWEDPNGIVTDADSKVDTQSIDVTVYTGFNQKTTSGRIFKGAANSAGSYSVYDRIEFLSPTAVAGTKWNGQICTTAGATGRSTAVTATGSADANYFTASASMSGNSELRTGDRIIAGATNYTITEIDYRQNYVYVTPVLAGDLSANAITFQTAVFSYINPAQEASISTLANDATPSVTGANLWLTGGTTTITDFDDGATGQIITVIAAHSLTITDGTNIFLNGSANFTMTATDTLTLIQQSDGKWYETGRSDSGA